MTENAAGQNSRVGERNFAASMVRFAVGKLATGVEALASTPALSSCEIEQMVRENAPILLFHPDEKYFPADPLQYLDHSELRHHRAILPDESLAERGEIDPAQLRSLDDEQYNFLDLDNIYRGLLGPRPDAGGASAAPIHYEVDQGPPFKVTYHVFYAYNDGPLSQNHEGDWEQITIEFKQSKQADGAISYEPDTINLSAHGGDSSVAWADAPKDENGRLLVFVAKGSHANYSSPGDKPTIYDNPDYLPLPTLVAAEELTDDATITDLNGDGRIDEGDGAVRLDLARSPLSDVRQQAWYPEQGGGVQWGERGSALNVVKRADFSGPQGPSEEKGHVG